MEDNKSLSLFSDGFLKGIKEGIEKMSVREISISLDTPERTIHNSIDRVFPGLKKNGIKTELDEYQVSLISEDLKKAHNTDLASTRKVATTDIELLLQSEKLLSALSLRLMDAKKEIEILTPKAEFYDRVTESNDTFGMGAVAKILNIKGFGRNNLIKYLKDEKIIMKSNEPYQKYLHYFKAVEVETSVGLKLKPVAFQKGVDFILKRIGK